MLAGRDETICLDARRHGIVLARPFVHALAFAAGGGMLVALGWPGSVAGAALLATAALVSLRAVWRWHRTRLIVTPERLLVVHGTLRRRAAAVGLGSLGALEVEQSLVGRLLGYGTLVVGDLEVPFVPRPERVCGLVERLASPRATLHQIQNV